MAQRKPRRAKPAPKSPKAATLLTKELIVQAEDCYRERVEVPEWGGVVFLRTMTGMERDLFDVEMMQNRNNDQIRARLLVRTLCDENGVNLFGLDEVVALGAKSGAVLDRLFQVARDVNGLKQDLDAIEMLEKNLQAVLGDRAPSS